MHRKVKRLLECQCLCGMEGICKGFCQSGAGQTLVPLHSPGRMPDRAMHLNQACLGILVLSRRIWFTSPRKENSPRPQSSRLAAKEAYSSQRQALEIPLQTIANHVFCPWALVEPWHLMFTSRFSPASLCATAHRGRRIRDAAAPRDTPG